MKLKLMAIIFYCCTHFNVFLHVCSKRALKYYTVARYSSLSMLLNLQGVVFTVCSDRMVVLLPLYALFTIVHVVGDLVPALIMALLGRCIAVYV